MSRRALLLGILGAATFIAVLVATAPASLLASAIERATQSRVALRDPQGSVWSGNGRLYARQAQGEMVDLGPLRWRARPASLLAGRLATEATFGDNPQPTAVDLTPSSLTVRDLDLQLPGTVLAAIDPALATLGPDGKVRIRSESLRIDRESILGLADVEWRDVRLARAKGLEFGSHVARLRGGGETVGIELATLSGPLQLKASGSWARSGAVSLSGSAEASGANLSAFLKSVCAQYRDGRCQFRYSRGL